MKRLASGIAALAWGALARAEPAASPIPYKQDAAAGAAALPGGALGLLLLSLLAIAAVYVVRKRLKLQPGGHGDAGQLRIVETQRLGPRTLLSVVEFSGSRYLIAQSEQGVSCLATAAVSVPAATGTTGTAAAAGAAAAHPGHSSTEPA